MNTKETGLSYSRLHEVLEYKHQTGEFFWIRGPGYRRDLDGRSAGNSIDGERGQIVIGGKHYRPHRLAWLYMTGDWPTGEIDHIDGNPSNNKWVNLRMVSRTTNQQNMRKAHKDNKTGLLGVTIKREKFSASICANKKRVSLGCYDTAEEVHAVYVSAKRELHEGCTI